MPSEFLNQGDFCLRNEPHSPQKVSPRFANPHSEPFPRRDPDKQGSGVLTGNKGLTLSHPARRLPSCLRASPPHTSGTPLLSHVRARGCGELCGPLPPSPDIRENRGSGRLAGSAEGTGRPPSSRSGLGVRGPGHAVGWGRGPGQRGVSRAAGTGSWVASTLSPFLGF